MNDHVIDPVFEIDRPRGAGKFYNFLINYKFQKAITQLPFNINNLTVLDLCCGSGMISEFYTKEGAKVTGTDISDDSIDRAKIRAKKYDFQAQFQVADTENLPFPDNSFDIVSVHDGLHHVKNPQKAINEMYRIARKGIIIIEPAYSLVTRISVALGISTDYEGDDFVYRLKKQESHQWLKHAGMKQIHMKRYLMYYQHKPGPFFRVFDIQPFFALAKLSFHILNLFFGGIGNKIQIIALK